VTSRRGQPTVRIAAGQGFWGDWLEAPYRQVTGGPIDYLMMDYLAEVTMSILQKQKSRDPTLGYATDFLPLMERILPVLGARRIKVTANAGGVNPRACAEAVAEAARRLGLAGKLRIGVVTGDDLLGRLDGLLARGHALKNLDTGRSLHEVRDRVLSANAYLGAWPVAAALRQGADVVITGRVTDTGLTLAPLIHAFGWRPDAWDLLAAGTVAGHTIECGAQCSGGNCLVDWEKIPDLANVGYPIVEAHPDGTFEVAKHPGTGGRITVGGVTEQLVYEMGDPTQYITPDCIADFTTIRLEQAGKTGFACRGSGGVRRPISSRCRSRISTATRPWERWCTPGRTRTRRPRPRTACCASGSRTSGSGSRRFSPNSWAPMRRTARSRAGAPRSMRCRRCSCGSACARPTSPPSSASRARSPP